MVGAGPESADSGYLVHLITNLIWGTQQSTKRGITFLGGRIPLEGEASTNRELMRRKSPDGDRLPDGGKKRLRARHHGADTWDAAWPRLRVI
jgi:hypothetical protein